MASALAYGLVALVGEISLTVHVQYRVEHSQKLRECTTRQWSPAYQTSAS